MRSLLLMLAVLFFHLLVHAQDFRIMKELPIDDNFCFTTLRYDYNDYGVGLLNNKGVMTKDDKLKSIPDDMAFMGDNILVISHDSKKTKTTGFNALLLNKKNLSVIKEEKLFQKTSSGRIGQTLIKDPNNNFCYVLFRETKYNEDQVIGTMPGEARFLESSSLQLISLNDNLQSKTIDIKTEAANSWFANACSDAGRNIYICSISNEAITVEKFDSNGKLVQKLSSPFTVWKNPDLRCIMKNDLVDQNIITVATSSNNGNKDQAHNLIRFDFTHNKTVKINEIIFNKDYLGALKNPNEVPKGKNFSSVRGMEVIQLLEDTNRLIMIKEIQATVSKGNRGDAFEHYRDGCIITIYKKNNLEVIKDIVVDKRLVTFVESSPGLIARLADNTLWAVTCENSGLTHFKSYINKINLATGENIKEEIEDDSRRKGFVSFSEQVVWFKKNYVVPFFRIVSPISQKFESEFMVRSY